MKVYIKNPAPALDGGKRWGDDYFGCSLADAFVARGCEVIQEYWPDWGLTPQDGIVLVLRGLRKWTPPKGGFRILWVLSHPLDVDVDELAAYDLILVASQFHASLLAQSSPTPVEVAMQCTDPRLFSAPSAPLERQVSEREGIIYVANSRKVRRDMAQWIDEIGPDVAIYGRGWSKFDLCDRVKAEHIPNAELGKVYQDARLVLNDHWLDMRTLGYVGNRIFDCLSCGIPVISDDFPALRDLLGDGLEYADSAAGLKAALERCDDHYRDVLERAQSCWRTIGPAYTFDQRAAEILNWAENPPIGICHARIVDGFQSHAAITASLRSAVVHEQQRASYYEARLQRMGRAFVAVERRLNVMTNSTSWRATRPLRQAKRLLSLMRGSRDREP